MRWGRVRRRKLMECWVSFKIISSLFNLFSKCTVHFFSFILKNKFRFVPVTKRERQNHFRLSCKILLPGEHYVEVSPARSCFPSSCFISNILIPVFGVFSIFRQRFFCRWWQECTTEVFRGTLCWATTKHTATSQWPVSLHFQKRIRQRTTDIWRWAFVIIFGEVIIFSFSPVLSHITTSTRDIHTSTSGVGCVTLSYVSAGNFCVFIV